MKELPGAASVLSVALGDSYTQSGQFMKMCQVCSLRTVCFMHIIKP